MAGLIQRQQEKSALFRSDSMTREELVVSAVRVDGSVSVLPWVIEKQGKITYDLADVRALSRMLRENVTPNPRVAYKPNGDPEDDALIRSAAVGQAAVLVRRRDENMPGGWAESLLVDEALAIMVCTPTQGTQGG